MIAPQSGLLLEASRGLAPRGGRYRWQAGKPRTLPSCWAGKAWPANLDCKLSPSATIRTCHAGHEQDQGCKTFPAKVPLAASAFTAAIGEQDHRMAHPQTEVTAGAASWVSSRLQAVTTTPPPPQRSAFRQWAAPATPVCMECATQAPTGTQMVRWVTQRTLGAAMELPWLCCQLRRNDTARQSSAAQVHATTVLPHSRLSQNQQTGQPPSTDHRQQV